MRSGAFSKIASLVLFALFIGVLLLALVAGVRVYGDLVSEKNASDNMRFANGVVANSVKGLDSYDALGVGEGPEGPALVMSEQTAAGTFAMRFYLFEGNLMQEYVPAERPCDPTSATPIMATSTFAFDVDDGLLTVRTDEGETDVFLRAGSSL